MSMENVVNTDTEPKKTTQRRKKTSDGVNADAYCTLLSTLEGRIAVAEQNASAIRALAERAHKTAMWAIAVVMAMAIIPRILTFLIVSLMSAAIGYVIYRAFITKEPALIAAARVLAVAWNIVMA